MSLATRRRDAQLSHISKLVYGATQMVPAHPVRPAWPASLRGVGFRIDQLPDGRYQAIAEGGYVSRPYPTAQAALVDVTAWCEQHAQGGW